MERLDHAATAKGLQEARRPGTDPPSRLWRENCGPASTLTSDLWPCNCDRKSLF